MKTNILLAAAALGCAVVAQPAVVSADEDTVTVRLPMAARERVPVRAIVRIPPDADNRLLRVTLDSGAFYRSSDVPLEGDAAARTHTLTWQALPAGTYEVTVQIVGTSRVKRLVRRQLHVIGLE